MGIPAWDLPLARKNTGMSRTMRQEPTVIAEYIYGLKETVYIVIHKTVLRVMQKYGLLSVIQKKEIPQLWRISAQSIPILLNRRF